MIGGTIPGFDSWEEAFSEQPAKKIEDESNGMQMLYSSGTTGRPKGILRPLPRKILGLKTMLQTFFRRFIT